MTFGRRAEWVEYKQWLKSRLRGGPGGSRQVGLRVSVCVGWNADGTVVFRKLVVWMMERWWRRRRRPRTRGVDLRVERSNTWSKSTGHTWILRILGLGTIPASNSLFFFKAQAQTPPTCAAAVASAPARDRGSACLVRVAETQEGWTQLSETRFDVVLLFVYFLPRRAARHAHPSFATTGWMTLIAQDIRIMEYNTCDCLTSENQATISVPLLTPWRSAKEPPSDPCFPFSLLPPALILVMPRSLACEHPGVVRSSPRLAVLSAIVPKSRLPWSRASAKTPESAADRKQRTKTMLMPPANQNSPFH